MTTTRRILLTIACAGSLLGALQAAESFQHRADRLSHEREMIGLRERMGDLEIEATKANIMANSGNVQESSRKQREHMRMANQKKARIAATALANQTLQRLESEKLKAERRGKNISSDAPKRETWLKEREARREELRKLEATR